MIDIKPMIQDILPDVISLRQDIHAYPELGYKEVETSRKILHRLEGIPGIHIRKEVAETGIIATLGREKKGPCVALRADMDCLSLQEETEKPYASQNQGLMHACGHDGHTACLVGAALVLGGIQDELKGPVKFIFQPAEEGGAGGLCMCREGALEDPRIDAIYGLHCHPGPDLELGEIAVCRGSAMAACGIFEVNIEGKGGHAAFPHACVDPIHVGILMGNAFQSIVSRMTDPLDSVVVSITKFHGGTALNIIPERASMEGSIRALKDELLHKTMNDIENQAMQIARAFGAEVDVTTKEVYPALVNHEITNGILHEVASLTGKTAAFRTDYPPTLGGEDFAYSTQQVPGTFWFLSTRPPDDQDYPFNHNPKFDFNDDALETGIEIHCETARHFASLWSQ
jgi:amidohydrolase